MKSWRFPSSACCKHSLTWLAAGCSLRSHANNAQASTTLEFGIVTSEFGAVFGFQRLGQAFPSARHSLHNTPVGEIPRQPLHHQRVALHIDRNLRAGFEIEPLEHCFGYGYLPF